MNFHTWGLCLCALGTNPVKANNIRLCKITCAEMGIYMISNQVLQTTIDGLKNITRIDICVMDIEGKALATTINNIEEYEEAVMAFVDSPADSQVLQGYQFFKVR